MAARGRESEWSTFQVAGFTDVVRVREVAVPTPRDGVRRAYEVLLIDQAAEEPLGFSTFVDARTGAVLVRESIVDYLADNPTWKVFPNTPRMSYSSQDRRELWCWEPGAPGCRLAVESDASSVWDVDARTGEPTRLTKGNNARSTEKWNSNDGPEQGVNYSASATRDYVHPWTNQWYEEGCNPAVFTSPQQNDIDASRANLFAMHNRMHDWSYRLGFTEATWNLQEFNFGRGGGENDPEHGNAQAGGIVGGPPTFASRDNANQFTPADGIAPTTNMYLWQPISASFYAPCVDGDYDMSVIGHEYGHAISNRMVAGPDRGLSGLQAQAMGESWSDLLATEYLNEYDLAGKDGENPYAVGAYVTSDREAGIRNFAMDASPLNYSDVGYDLTGPQVHADGEIWSATNQQLRELFNARYDRSFPSRDRNLQRRCADGELPVERCPGNRRWMQLTYDAWLLMAVGQVSMVDARDAMLAADRTRFGGANQDILWYGFATGGLGEGAVSLTTQDSDPTPDFKSPLAPEGTVTLASGAPALAELFVGQYEARATPVADNNPATPRGTSAALVPGRYDLVVRAPGHGIQRSTVNITPGRDVRVGDQVPRNHASAANGATATGDGTNQDKLIDDTEATQWASLGRPVEGRQVTVALGTDGRSVDVRRVQVSALLRPTDAADPNDPGSQSRVSALRAFEILACDDTERRVGCTDDRDFDVVYRSRPDAFPSIAPRPRAPDLITRSFGVKRTEATHVRLRVLTNQCTGAPDYAGEQDEDPRAATDCTTSSTQSLNVRAAELQVFDR